MSYIDSNLQLDEKILHRGKIHWFIFIPGLVAFFLSVYFLSFQEEGIWFIGLLLCFLGITKVIDAFIQFTSTELVITTKRTISKTGLVSRNIVELNHNKVESINFNQGILGRIFDFGTVMVCGTGTGKNSIPNIIDPVGFKNNALKIIDFYSKKNTQE